MLFIDTLSELTCWRSREVSPFFTFLDSLVKVNARSVGTLCSVFICSTSVLGCMICVKPLDSCSDTEYLINNKWEVWIFSNQSLKGDASLKNKACPSSPASRALLLKLPACRPGGCFSVSLLCFSIAADLRCVFLLVFWSGIDILRRPFPRSHGKR